MSQLVAVVVVWALVALALVPLWAWALRDRRREERAAEAAAIRRELHRHLDRRAYWR